MSKTQPPRTPTAADLQDKPPLPRPPRLKPLRTKADIDAISYFDDEEREIALEYLLRSVRNYGNQPTITVATAAHDPKGARAKARLNEALNPLIDNDGLTRHTTQGSVLHLMVYLTLKHVNDECLVGALATGNVKRGAVPAFKPHHLAMVDFPESEVWSDQQRLSLKFTKAVLNSAVTDEIWDAAVKMWGVKKVLGYIQMIGNFWYVGTRNRVLNVHHPVYRDRNESA
jgi:hypothetical protein